MAITLGQLLLIFGCFCPCYLSFLIFITAWPPLHVSKACPNGISWRVCFALQRLLFFLHCFSMVRSPDTVIERVTFFKYASTSSAGSPIFTRNSSNNIKSEVSWKPFDPHEVEIEIPGNFSRSRCNQSHLVNCQRSSIFPVAKFSTELSWLKRGLPSFHYQNIQLIH